MRDCILDGLSRRKPTGFNKSLSSGFLPGGITRCGRVKIRRVQSHPHFAGFCEFFREHPEYFKPWSGIFFRFQTIEFATPGQVLSGHGAGQHGGRWNPPGLPTLYGSTTDTTALAECKANDRYYGVVTTTPRLLVAVTASLPRMIDLTERTTRRRLGVTLDELAAEDWRKLLYVGQESLPQAIGRAVAATGGSGLMVHSAAIPRGVNVVIFPGNGGELTLVEGEKLAKLEN